MPNIPNWDNPLYQPSTNPLFERNRRTEALKAENAALKGAIDSVLADAVTQGYDPDDCPDWYDGLISCDSLKALYRCRYPGDTTEGGQDATTA